LASQDDKKAAEESAEVIVASPTAREGPNQYGRERKLSHDAEEAAGTEGGKPPAPPEVGDGIPEVRRSAEDAHRIRKDKLQRHDEIE
jgi:hypothetical protein